MGQIEVDIVGDGEIEFAIAVIVDEGAAGAPFLAGAGYTGLFGDLFEGAVALIVKEAIFAIARDVEVVEAVVIVVANADALSPAGGDEASLRSYVGEGAIVIVVEEMAGGRFRSGLALGRLVPLTRKMSGQPSRS